jgi:uncharacterized membrane protein YqiK
MKKQIARFVPFVTIGVIGAVTVCLMPKATITLAVIFGILLISSWLFAMRKTYWQEKGQEVLVSK